MKLTSRNLIIFLCIIKLVVGTQGECEQLTDVSETTDETTTEMLQVEQTTTEETTTFAVVDVPVETTTLMINSDVLVVETTTTLSVEEATTPTTQINKLEETVETTTITIPDLTTPASVELDNYAVNQMNFILNHILQTFYDFVSNVLQESDNSINQRDKLKQYAEVLYRLLGDANEDAADYDPKISSEDLYNIILKKFTFLKAKGTKYLHKYLPEQWLQTHEKNKQEISIWLDKTSEQMREEFNSYVSGEDDQVKFQYFNEAFDDIPRANEIHQKLTILVDLVKIAINKKQITFMDLYMQQSLHCLPDGRATCRSVPGLTKDQLELCYKASDVTTAALEGLDLAIRECQTQFQWHRWNCSSLNTKSRNPHASSLLKKGYRESAFAFAISAAGVAHSVARACSQGRLMSCGCDPSVNRKTLNKNLRQSLDKEKKQFLQYLETNQIQLNPEDEKKYERSKIASRWKWGGCSHNMDFGVEFSKLFLDCREKAGDIQSKINLHNNHAGRISVSNNMEFRCKCHGMSGSCQLKTCWKSAPDFHVVGKVLKHQFRRALLVDQSNLGNGEPIVVLKRSRNKKSNNANGNNERTNERHERPSNAKSNSEKNAQRSARKLETSLFYYQRSPNFCERDPSADILGTVGRKCNRNSTLSDGCTSLCCGRGYSLVKERRAERCHCKFQWCCNVECDECHVEEWISVCN